MCLIKRVHFRCCHVKGYNRNDQLETRSSRSRRDIFIYRSSPLYEVVAFIRERRHLSRSSCAPGVSVMKSRCTLQRGHHLLCQSQLCDSGLRLRGGAAGSAKQARHARVLTSLARPLVPAKPSGAPCGVSPLTRASNAH